MSCELCRLEKLTEWKYEDDILVICKCKTHPNKWMAVLRRHTKEPNLTEKYCIVGMINLHFNDDVKWRGPNSIKDHYHLHEV